MKYILVLYLLCSFSLRASAQAGSGEGVTTVHKGTNPAELIIKDSSGTVYPPNIVRGLMMSGKYGIRSVPGTNEGLLYLIPEKEREKMEANAPKPRESSFFGKERHLPPFKERDMEGTRFNLKELRGKVVVLNFWFINCPPCRQEIPQLNSLVEKYRENKDIVFIAIALDEKPDLQDFLKTTPFNYHIIDNGRYLAADYKINLFPTHVVIDRQGKVLFHASGLSIGTAPWLRKSIEAGLNNSPLK